MQSGDFSQSRGAVAGMGRDGEPALQVRPRGCFDELAMQGREHTAIDSNLDKARTNSALLNSVSPFLQPAAGQLSGALLMSVGGQILVLARAIKSGIRQEVKSEAWASRRSNCGSRPIKAGVHSTSVLAPNR